MNADAAPPAEAPQLRPLGVGDIVDRVFSMYRAKPGLYLIVAAIPYLVFVVVIALVTAGLVAVLLRRAPGTDPFAILRSPEPGTLATVFVGALAIGVIVAIIALVIFSAQSAALVAAFAARYLGREMSAGDALRAGLRAAPRVIGAGILLGLLLVVVWAIGIVAMAITQHVVVVIVASIALLVCTVYVLASTVVMPIVATLEGAGPLDALRRAWQLSEGGRWRIIGLEVLLIVLNVVLSALVAALFFAVPQGTTEGAIVQQVANLIVSIAWTPVQWGTFTILYYDLRVRREAFDLQLAAEALPRAD